jgi:hypothetical protein
MHCVEAGTLPFSKKMRFICWNVISTNACAIFWEGDKERN